MRIKWLKMCKDISSVPNTGSVLKNIYPAKNGGDPNQELKNTFIHSCSSHVLGIN